MRGLENDEAMTRDVDADEPRSSSNRRHLNGANGTQRKDSTVSMIAAAAIASSSIVAMSTTIARAPTEIRAYPKRFLILAIFVLLSASNALQWIQYSIVAHVISDYYGVSFALVDWTSMIYMLTYMVLIFPGSWFLDKYGLRKSLLIGAFGNCLGAWIKLCSTSPDKFWVTFIGQTIVGSSQIFILGIPPRLAAVWFGPKQVSTACAIGVFGNQLGIAIGFIIPPFLVHMGSKDEVGHDLSILFLMSAITNTIIAVFVLLFFVERPPLPPSLAQAQALKSQETNFMHSLKELSSNKNYILLLITYGINVGVFYAISTLLSQMILTYHEHEQESTGTTGLIIVISGMIGSVVTGYILDKFHHFKATTLSVYFFSFIGMILFTFTLSFATMWEIFIIAGLLGFFMTGYLPLGFEFAAELTFPIAEGTTSGLLNASAQFFGIVMTFAMGQIMYLFSVFWCNITMSVFLLIGFFMTALIKSDLRRQKAHAIVDIESPNSEEEILNTENKQ